MPETESIIKMILYFRLKRAPQDSAMKKIEYHLALLQEAESASENPAKKQKLANNTALNRNTPRMNKLDNPLKYNFVITYK